MDNDHGHQHSRHRHHHDDTDWGAMGDVLEAEGDVLADFVRDAAAWVGERCGNDPVERIVDVGSGPGVGSCIFAQHFRAATVTAVDASGPLLERVAARALRLGVAGRVVTRVGDLSDTLPVEEPADVVWASMVLHHVADQPAALAGIRTGLRGGGWLAIAEFGAPLQCLPDSALGDAAGVWARCQAAVRSWLPDPVAGEAPTLRAALLAAGFAHVEQREMTIAIPAPISVAARAYVVQFYRRLREIVATRVDATDLAVVDTLLDAANPLGLHQRADLFVRVGRMVTTAQAVAR